MTQEKSLEAELLGVWGFLKMVSVSLVCSDCSLLLNSDSPKVIIWESEILLQSSPCLS